MSHQAHHWVCTLPPAATTHGEYRLLQQLADFADARGRKVFPSLETLIARTGFVPRTIELAIQKFLREEWLRRVGRRRSGPAEYVFPHVERAVENLRKSCAEPVDALNQGSLFVQWPLDPPDQNSAVTHSAAATFRPDQSGSGILISQKEEEARRASSLLVSPQTTELDLAARLALLRAVEARIRISDLEPRRRRRA